MRASLNFVTRLLPGSLLVVLLGAFLSSPLSAADLVSVPELGLRIARGFRVSLYADNDLAPDIYAMTLDVHGRVVVTSQGWIKTLLDTDGNGVADTAQLFAPTKTGGMGLCFDGNDLYFTGDGGFYRYLDRNGDGQADGEPDKLLALNFSEHGAHAPRKGPDGWWYLIGGNDSGFNAGHATLATSPIRNPEAGALVRLSPDGAQSEILAHGFRNPYDFDFNPAGDLFTWDSDVESDYFLPWYTPTRIYHIGIGLHHGWRLNGWRRSWNRPGYYADTVDSMQPMGRGSPTGVTCYRHFQFPTYYQNGLFALDWTFGKVWFLPLTVNGASYQTQPEVFLEPMGTHGFAPTDIAVARDGSLFISIGGRKTRGGVYRIEYAANGPRPPFTTNWAANALTMLEAALTAPQPLDAWSRAYWIPLAAQLGAGPFDEVVADESAPAALRVRAIEILTEVHGGLTTAAANAGARTRSPLVRARTAWSLGRIPCENFAPTLFTLARDNEPFVRRWALEAIAEQLGNLNSAAAMQAAGFSTAHADKRVRLAAARLGAMVPDNDWVTLATSLLRSPPQGRLTSALIQLWRKPASPVNGAAINTCLEVLEQSRLSDHQLQALRLIILALGDYHLNSPAVEAYTGYELPNPVKTSDPLFRKIRVAARAVLPSGDSAVDTEAARLLAMLEDDDPKLPRQLVSLCNARTSATDDFHFLTVLSRLRGWQTNNVTTNVAHIILSLERKLAGQEQRVKQNWSVRLAEVVQNLLRRDDSLADALLKHPDFATPGHLPLAMSLGSTRYLDAARIYLAATKRNPKFNWSGPLIELLSSLPAEEVRPLFRQQWTNSALHDDLVLKLAQNPAAIDRDKFITGLESPQHPVARASLSALLQLPVKGQDPALTSTLRLLRHLCREPQEKTLRAQAMALVCQETDQMWRVQELGDDLAALQETYQPVFTWCRQKYPALARPDDGSDDPAKWELALKNVPWNKGDPANGEAIFRARGCAICHTTASAIGPDLAGVTARLSPVDLFTAIAFPNRDIAAPFRTTVFQMRDGQSYTGLVLFDSADGVMLQTSASVTVRLADADIVSRKPSNVSLMPTGLLDGLKPQDLADLHRLLRTL